MKNFKKVLVPGLVLGMGVMLCANDAAPAPAAPAAPSVPETPTSVSVAQAFAFLPEVVATYNGKNVTRDQFVAELSKQLPDGMLPAGFPVEMLKMQAAGMIEQYVTLLVVEQAVADAKIAVTSEDIAKQIREEIASMPKEQLAMIEQALQAQGMTLEAVIKQQSEDPEAIKRLALERFFESRIGKITVTEADAEKFYKENPDQFNEPGDPEGSVRASHILIQVPENADEAAWAKAKAEAEAILAALKNGADFAKLAAEKSACPSKEEGGSLGAFTKGQMVPEFEAAAFALNVGELSAPVKTQFGYHIIRRDAAAAGRVIPFAEIKDRLIAYLEQEKRMEAANKIVEELVKAANVKILVAAPEVPVAAPAAPAN